MFVDCVYVYAYASNSLMLSNYLMNIVTYHFQKAAWKINCSYCIMLTLKDYKKACNKGYKISIYISKDELKTSNHAISLTF